jgi:hypothetical protein
MVRTSCAPAYTLRRNAATPWKHAAEVDVLALDSDELHGRNLLDPANRLAC